MLLQYPLHKLLKFLSVLAFPSSLQQKNAIFSSVLNMVYTCVIKIASSSALLAAWCIQSASVRVQFTGVVHPYLLLCICHYNVFINIVVVFCGILCHDIHWCRPS